MRSLPYLFALLLCLVYAPASAVIGKAQAPLTIILTPEITPSALQLDLAIEVHSQRAVENAEIALRLPAGVTLEAGSGRWRGALQPDSPLTLHATLRYPPRQRITLYVRATLSGAGGEITRWARYTFGDEEEPAAKASNTLRHGWRHGRSIVEIPLEAGEEAP